jgi:hypothetical protein
VNICYDKDRCFFSVAIGIPSWATALGTGSTIARSWVLDLARQIRTARAAVERPISVERLRADVLSLASDAMATLRELVSRPDVPPSVGLRASLAVLQAADALNAEQIGPMSAEGVQAKMEHERFLESLEG